MSQLGLWVLIDRKEEERKVDERDRNEVRDRSDLDFGSVLWTFDCVAGNSLAYN